MQLLDLPLEVFRAILEETVIVLGPDRAPRLRLVNSKYSFRPEFASQKLINPNTIRLEFFDDEVMRAVCMTGILECSSPMNFVYGPWLAYYLQRRVLAHRAQDNKNYLLCTLRGVGRQTMRRKKTRNLTCLVAGSGRIYRVRGLVGPER